MSLAPLLAVIPARGGSKGMPGKNIQPFAGLPLIAHSIRFSAMVPQIDRCIVSTDSEQIAAVAQAHGGEVPFLRPAELARDETPMWPVLQHALQEMERLDQRRYESFLLLDPTSPGRIPEDVTHALKMLEEDEQASGVIAVSEPKFNPRWVCVEERDGYIVHAFTSRSYVRRQDVPKVYRINAVLYLWRRRALVDWAEPQWDQGRHRMLMVPEERAMHIDDRHDFQLGELMVRSGLVRFPWLSDGRPA